MERGAEGCGPGAETLQRAAARAAARSLRMLDPARTSALPAPCHRLLLREAIQLKTVDDGLLALFVPTFHLDLADSLMLTDAALEHVAAPLQSLSLYRASSFTAHAMAAMLARTPTLTELNASRCGHFDDDVLSALGQHCPHLHLLDMTRLAALSSRALCASLAQLTVLRKLVLFAVSNVDDAVLTTVARCMPRLESLSLARCGRITDAGVCDVVRGCPALRDLILAHCRRLTDVTLHAMCTVATLQFTDFTSLSLLSEHALCEFVRRRGPGLRILYFSFCANVTARVIETVGRCAPHLQRLYLSRQPAIGDASITCIAHGCAELEVLNLSGLDLTDASLVEVATHCRKLRTLYLSGNTRLTPRTMDALTLCNDWSAAEAEAVQLETCGCTELITTASIATLAACKWGAWITALDFTSNANVVDESMAPLARYCASLLWLSLSRTAISDVGVLILAAPTSKVTRLDLLNLTQTGITERSLPVIVSRFPHLTKLYLSSCLQLGMYGTGEAMPPRVCKLEALFLSFCSQLTGDALLYLIGDSGSNLSCIMANRCTGLSDMALSRLPLLCPALTLADLSQTSVSDATLALFAMHSSFLATLVLWSCVNITSTGVIAVLQRCTMLRTLCCALSSGVDDAILPSVEAALQLQTIALSNTGCTDAGVAALRVRRPRLQINRRPNKREQGFNADDEEG